MNTSPSRVSGPRQPAAVLGVPAALLAGCIAALCTPHASAQLRVANYNVAQLRGDALALEDVLAAAAADDRPGFATAPAIIAMQEVRAVDRPILEAIVAAAIPGAVYVTATYTTSGFEDGNGGAQLLLYRGDLLTEVPADHDDISTGGGRNSDRWHLKLDGYDSPQASLWIYGVHLKAGSASSDVADRLAGAQALRDDADSLPADSHVIFCGDFNLGSSSETAYLEFLAAGAGQCIDPLGSGSWSGAGNAIKHTQSPRDIAADELIGGGMDDRFDFQLVATDLDDGDGLSIMPGAYRSLGNDGQHYNQAINAGNNAYWPDDIPASNALADDLFDASDHIPVVAEYRIPGVLSAAMAEDFGRVLVGNAATVEVLVANIATVVVPSGVDTLEYVVQGLDGLGGPINGSVGGLPEIDSVALPIDTSTVGFLSGVASVTTASEGAQFPSYLLFTSGSVVRHANPSLSLTEDLDVAEFEFVFTQGTGVQAAALPIRNVGFDADQALLDVDAVDGAEAPLAVVGPHPKDIGAAAGGISLAVDTGVAPGVYGAALTITCSDEDLQGASTFLVGALITIVIEPAGEPSDLDHDGDVDGADLGILLAGWGPCPGCAADFDGDGDVDGADLGVLLAAWG